MKLGSHICSIYKDKEQQFSQAIQLLMEGLENNQKCFYIADKSLKDEIILNFEKHEFSLKKHIDTKQFVFLSVDEFYLKDNVFDPKKTVESIKDIEKDTLKSGFVGIRGVGEMAWVGNDPSYGEKLIEYESSLNDFLQQSKCTTICQYNEKEFDPGLLINIIRAHPDIIIYGKYYKNKYFYTPTEYMKEESGEFIPSDYKTIIDTIITE